MVVVLRLKLGDVHCGVNHLVAERGPRCHGLSGNTAVIFETLLVCFECFLRVFDGLSDHVNLLTSLRHTGEHLCILLVVFLTLSERFKFPELIEGFKFVLSVAIGLSLLEAQFEIELGPQLDFEFVNVLVEFL